MSRPKDFLDDSSSLVHEAYMLQEGAGQNEGRETTRAAVISFLSQYFPDQEITPRNFKSFLSQYMEMLDSGSLPVFESPKDETPYSK